MTPAEFDARDTGERFQPHRLEAHPDDLFSVGDRLGRNGIRRETEFLQEGDNASGTGMDRSPEPIQDGHGVLENAVHHVSNSNHWLASKA